jgi:phosphatidylglycerol:prolipoprotein diacylglycerol transferase
VLFAFYLVIAGFERFFVEFVRRNEDVAIGLTAAQLESLALFVLGVIVVLRMRRSGPLFLSEPAPHVAPAAART